MEFKGTKGNWDFIRKPSTGQTHEIRKVQSSQGIAICMVRTNNEDQARANGQAISAVPEMIEALQIAMKAYQELGLQPNQSCYKQAEKALNKALGV